MTAEDRVSQVAGWIFALMFAVVCGFAGYEFGSAIQRSESDGERRLDRDACKYVIERLRACEQVPDSIRCLQVKP